MDSPSFDFKFSNRKLFAKLDLFFLVGVVSIIIAIFVYYFDTPYWSEWQLVGEKITCGEGVQVYTRKCNISTIARQISRACLGEDTKTEEIVLQPCVSVQ